MISYKDYRSCISYGVVTMDDSGQRENGRHKIDQYKSVHSQWMVPHHQLKDNPNIRMLINERDKALQELEKAIQERDLALAEKKSALVERDMLRLQRDAAVAERNNAIVERDNAIAALEYAQGNGMNANCGSGCPSSSRGGKHVYHDQQQHLQLVHPRPQQMSDVSYNQTRETQAEAFPLSAAPETSAKAQKTKRPRKETKVQPSSSKRPAKSLRKSKRSGADNLNTQVTIAKTGGGEWTGEVGVGEDLNKQTMWKSQDLGLNQVAFDDSAMPSPVCSCTGKYQQCYKWGSGGWQSACCTMTLSMYPLPVMPNKRHARVAGRKMSGSAFRKLLSRLASEGHDLSLSVDLKEHWSKHGTNRYITIK